MTINYELLPEHIREGARKYIEEGRHPGGFLTAVVQNDLFSAFAKSDEINARRMRDILYFFWNEAPGECFGGKDKMDEWIKKKAEEKARNSKECKAVEVLDNTGDY